MTNSATRNLRFRLLAASALVCAGAAAGQSYNANGSAQGASIDQSTPGRTIVTVRNPTAVINWFPTDNATGTPNPVNFQNAGTTATFNGTSNFTVLNNISAAFGRAIQFNGTTESFVNGQQGGNLWFYSPYGIILGPTARFNIGGLMFTTSSIPSSSPSGTPTPPVTYFNDRATSFSSNFQPNATIRIDPTSNPGQPQINAIDYVAIIAPRIDMAGYVYAAGEVLYASGDQGSLTLPYGSQNLFSINIGRSVPSTLAGPVLSHTGITSGPGRPASPPPNPDPSGVPQQELGRNIYFVAARPAPAPSGSPSVNSAVTMLLGGTIGYDAANSAYTGPGDTIILNGNGQIAEGANVLEYDSLSAQDAVSATIASGTLIKNNFDAVVTNLTVNATTADTSFLRNFRSRVAGVTTFNVGDATVPGGAGRTLAVGGSLTASGFADINSAPQAGQIAVNMRRNALMTVGRTMTLDASFAGALTDGGAPGPIQGGSVRLDLIDSRLRVGGDGVTGLRLLADGKGGSQLGGDGSDGTGGTVAVNLTGSQLDVLSGGLTATAIGTGGAGYGFVSTGGEGRGGNVTIALAAGNGTYAPSLGVAQALSLDAGGFGGGINTDQNSDNGVGAGGGNGTGGTARLTVAAGSVAADGVTIAADGRGGDGGSAAFRGQAGPVPGGVGGTGTGGTAQASVAAGAALRGRYIAINANGTGGDGGATFTGQFGSGGDAGAGGAGLGGTAALDVAGDVLLTDGEVSLVSVAGAAAGGKGGASESAAAGMGGRATGGTASLAVRGGGRLMTDPQSAPDGSVGLSVDAGAIGGNGGEMGTGASGGAAAGGSAALTVDGGMARARSARVAAAAFSGVGTITATTNGDVITNATTATATGGNATVSAINAGQLTLSVLDLDTSAQLAPLEATGLILSQGSAMTGGRATLAANGGGLISVADQLTVNSGATTGDALLTSGNATAGAIDLLAASGGGIAVAGVTRLDSSAFAGTVSGPATTAGNAVAGAVSVIADGTGTTRIGFGSSTTIDTTARGGDATAASGVNGSARAGDVTLAARNGALLSSGGDTFVNATATRGAGNGAAPVAATRGGGVQLSATAASFQLGGSFNANVSATGAGAQAGSIAIGVGGNGAGIPASFMGATSLIANNLNGTAGTVALANAATGGAGPLTIGGTLTVQTRGVPASPPPAFQVTANGARIVVSGAATIDVGTGNAAVAATGAGGIDFNGGARIDAANFSASHASPAGDTVGGGDAGTSLIVNATGAITAGTGTRLRGDSVVLTAGGAIALDTLLARDTIVATAGGNLDARSVVSSGSFTNATNGAITLTAGAASPQTGLYGPGNLTVTGGPVAGSGNVLMRAGGTVRLTGNAGVTSANGIRLEAGNDIVVGSGSVLRAGSGANAAATGGVTLTTTLPANSVPGNVRAIYLDGQVFAGAQGDIALSADAIQAGAAVLNAGRNVTAQLSGAPAAGPQANDGGQLNQGCLAGDICLGQITAGGTLTAGYAAGPQASQNPLMLRVTGPVSAGTVDIHAANSMILGGASGTTTFNASGDARFEVTGGSLQTGAGSTAITAGGLVTLATGTDVLGQRLAVTGGSVALAVGRDLTLASLTATNGGIGGVGAPQASIGRALSITSLSANGNVDLRAPGGISIGTAQIGDGFDLSLDAGGSDLSLTSAAPGPNGRARSILLKGRAITAGTLAASRDVTLSGTGAVAVTTDLISPAVFATGTTVSLTALTALNIAQGNATAGAFTATSGGTLQFGTTSATGAVIGRAATGIGFTRVAGASADLRTTAGGITGDRIVTTGTTLLDAGGDIDVGTELTASSVSARGRSIRINQTAGALTVTQATATGGPIALSSAGNLRLDAATGPGDIGATSTGGNVQLGTVAAGGTIRGRGATGLTFTVLNGQAADLTADSGAISGAQLNTTGAASLTAAGAVTVTALGTGATSARGSSVALTGPGALNLTQLTATGGDIVLRGGGALTVAAATASGGIDAATTNGALQLGTSSAGGTLRGRATSAIGFIRLTAANIDLASTVGDIVGTRLGATGSVLLDTTGMVATQVDSGAVTAHGSAITLTAPGALNVVSATADTGGISLRSVGDLSLATATGRTFIDAASTGGALTVGNARVTGTGGITLAAATGATLNGPVTATGALDVTAGAIAINGATSGANASFKSGSIAFGQAGAVTSPGTVTFQNTGTQRTTLGGSAAGTGYILNQAAFDRVRAGSIAVIAPAAGANGGSGPDVTIADLTLRTTGSNTPGNLGATGTFSVTTPGSIQVTGNLLLSDAAAGNVIRLTGGSAIGVTLPTGSIRVAATGGAPIGLIELAAPRITIATAAAATDLAALTTTAARTTRLARNDGGTTDDAGGISADRLSFRISQSLYIQNTGGVARADRRGFTAGAGGVDIVATGTAPAEFVVNGRINGVAGDGIINQLRLTGPLGQTPVANFVGPSAANDCMLVGGCPVSDVGVPTQDVVNAVQDALRTTIPPLFVPVIDYLSNDLFSYTPTIEEPVTGAGNDSLWTGVGIGAEDEADGLATGTGVDQEGSDPACPPGKTCKKPKP